MAYGLSLTSTLGPVLMRPQIGQLVRLKSMLPGHCLTSYHVYRQTRIVVGVLWQAF